MFLVDRAGRRFLLVGGSYAAAVAMACLAAAYAANQAFLALLFMCAFMFAFSASWAGVFWVLMSELFSMRAKSAAISACTALLFATGQGSSIHWSLGPFIGPLVHRSIHSFIIHAPHILSRAVFTSLHSTLFSNAPLTVDVRLTGPTV